MFVYRFNSVCKTPEIWFIKHSGRTNCMRRGFHSDVDKISWIFTPLKPQWHPSECANFNIEGVLLLIECHDIIQVIVCYRIKHFCLFNSQNVIKLKVLCPKTKFVFLALQRHKSSCHQTINNTTKNYESINKFHAQLTTIEHKIINRLCSARLEDIFALVLFFFLL